MKKFWFSLLSIIMPASAVTFQDNDTVVLLGNTMIERAPKIWPSRNSDQSLGWKEETKIP
ncbi:hypothetical protein OAP08_05735 [Akkermansiaceae bacterium]|nr:hypothetical protein [Akkermansiaceae bacterium]